MDNSPPRLPLRINLPAQSQAFPQGTPPQQVPARRPQMHQWADEISSGEEGPLEEAWSLPARAEPDESWLQRLSPFSRFCCEAGGMQDKQGVDAVLTQAKQLLAQGADIFELDAVTGRSPLHWACYGGCTALVQLLSEAEATAGVDLPDRSGATPLCIVINSPRLNNPASIVEFLLLEGAELNKLPNGGNELLHVDWLTIPIATYLVAAGLNLNTPDRFRETPLLRACTGNQLPLAQYLLLHGANPNFGGLFKRTILHSGNLSEAAAFLLIQNGAQVDLPDEQGVTPLMFAIHCENLELAKLLVANGASVSKKSADGMSVLDYAVQAGGALHDLILRKMGLSPDASPTSD